MTKAKTTTTTIDDGNTDQSGLASPQPAVPRWPGDSGTIPDSEPNETDRYELEYNVREDVQALREKLAEIKASLDNSDANALKLLNAITELNETVKEVRAATIGHSGRIHDLLSVGFDRVLTRIHETRAGVVTAGSIDRLPKIEELPRT